MDNPISAIIEIDKQARASADAAKAEAAKIIADAEAGKKALREESTAAMNEEAEKHFGKVKTASDSEIAAFEKSADEKCRMLDEKMAAGRDGWKKEITARILGRN